MGEKSGNATFGRITCFPLQLGPRCWAICQDLSLVSSFSVPTVAVPSMCKHVQTTALYLHYLTLELWSSLYPLSVIRLLFFNCIKKKVVYIHFLYPLTPTALSPWNEVSNAGYYNFSHRELLIWSNPMASFYFSSQLNLLVAFDGDYFPFGICSYMAFPWVCP